MDYVLFKRILWRRSSTETTFYAALQLETGNLPPSPTPYTRQPSGSIVTLTKGLANNIVLELRAFNLSAFAYCRESLADARRSGINLTDDIRRSKWQVVCVDPEHLQEKEWRTISEWPDFRAKLLYSAVDEAHLINEWGPAFRLVFTTIGQFFRGRFPSSTSVVGLSATLAPGPATSSVCTSLGLFEGTFHLIRRSNERPNVQFIMKTLTHGLAGYEFPDLLPYLNSGRKLSIHCATLDLVFRVDAKVTLEESTGTDGNRQSPAAHGKKCYIALINRHYGNPPLELTTLDCIAANRLLPCSLCIARANKTLVFDAPPSSIVLPPFTPPSSVRSPALSTADKKLKLKTKERKLALSGLKEFRNKLRVEEQLSGRFRNHPPSLFLPPSILNAILDALLFISSSSDLDALLTQWYHRQTRTQSLFETINQLQTKIHRKREKKREETNRKARERRQANKRKADDGSAYDQANSDFHDPEDHSHEPNYELDGSNEGADPPLSNDDTFPATIPLPQPRPRKRRALETVTNTSRSRTRVPLQKAAEVSKEYGPQYRPRVRTNHTIE
ncbi:hypothetical protein B0H17DRAFT_1203130 [Mycena rosella]|uniref:Helicase ATP-binding domain-containing protein n=1 Tax=Mycena rosella TaxID=1033263 RepID=A0AAD7DCM3_MYCRO|nr:hypothetical protein B0H17DRAFT_1203130 [Mycena rosella]